MQRQESCKTIKFLIFWLVKEYKIIIHKNWQFIFLATIFEYRKGRFHALIYILFLNGLVLVDSPVQVHVHLEENYW